MSAQSGLHRFGETNPGIRDQTEARVESGPDFLCIGLQKAGTYWLYDQLEQHPGFLDAAVERAALLQRFCD